MLSKGPRTVSETLGHLRVRVMDKLLLKGLVVLPLVFNRL
jgi:hypothetical protein